MLRQFQQAATIFAFTVVRVLLPQAALAQSQPEILPTGMSITPLAEPGTTFQFLNPGLPTLPDFRVDMAVTSALSPDGNTLLILTLELFAGCSRCSANHATSAAYRDCGQSTSTNKNRASVFAPPA